LSGGLEGRVFYGFMRHRQTVKDNVIALKKENGELTEIDQEIADLLLTSTYFQQVYTTEDSTSIPQIAQTVFGWKDINLKFDIDTVVERLQKLKTKKSPGPDSIHPLLLNVHRL